MTHDDYPDSFIEGLYETARGVPPGESKRALLWFLCLIGSSSGRLADCVEPSQLRALLDHDESKGFWRANFVRRPDEPGSVRDWLEFFKWLGSSDILNAHYSTRDAAVENHDDAWCETLQEAFAGEGTRRSASRLDGSTHVPAELGLLRLLGRLASAGYTMGPVPVEMLTLASFSEPRFKLAALLVRIAQRNLSADQAQQLAHEAIALLEPPAEEGADHLVFRTVEAHITESSAIDEFLVHLRERMPAEVPLGVAKCERLLRRVVRTRASSLQSLKVLRRLQLPVVDGS
jgi:hypothetical protein